MRFRAVVLAVTLTTLLAAREPVRARHAMVGAQEPIATDVGVQVLRSGGNAVDAAVAVGLALAVTHPYAGNIGGGGFMLIRLASGETNFIDFRERAPLAASHDMYLDAQGRVTTDSVLGWRAAGVPGSVRGFEAAHKKYGKKPWAELVAPAVQLAAKGFPASYQLSRSLTMSKELAKFPDSNRIFLRNGHPWEPGETFVQPDLAKTLARIQKEGARDFYEGETAHQLAAAMKANGGLITLDDLKNYQVAERKPLTGTYRGYGIITAPPPSSGGVGILQMFGVLEGSGYEKLGFFSAASEHYIAETMRRYYADRSEYMGDPDFVDVPVRKLLDPRYIHHLRESINSEHATPSSDIRPGNLTPYESTETTHYNVVDSEGNAVAVTYTLNGGYGSKVTVPGLGFLLNNEMDDFAAKPGVPNMFGLIQGERNSIQPGRRPLSSMTPTIVTKDDKLFLAVGAPGGSRIINGVFQVILNVIDRNMNPQDAIDAPRIHHQWQPDKLYLEKGFSPDTIALLKSRGHAVEPDGGAVAVVEAILSKDGWLQGGSDGRASGKAAGF